MAIYKYPVIIEKAKRNFSAYCPDLPGCIATGKTVDETQRNMRQAVRLHIEGLKKDGLPVPKPSESLKYKVNSDEFLTGVEIAA